MARCQDEPLRVGTHPRRLRRAVLNPRQERERERIERAGGLYIVARSVDDVEAALVAAGLARPILT